MQTGPPFPTLPVAVVGFKPATGPLFPVKRCPPPFSLYARSPYLPRVQRDAALADLSTFRDARVARETLRLAAAQRVHDRIRARLREARRGEFERAARQGLSVEQIAGATGLPVETVRQVLRQAS